MLIHALFLAGVLAAQAPDEPAPVWRGVWQGTVGDAQVRLCLDRRGGGYTVGSYYYLRHLRPIPLEQVERSAVWLEGESSATTPRPRWTFDAVSGQRLTGRWSQGARTLPFRLTPLAFAEGDNAPCGSVAFSQPRLRPLRITATPKRLDGVGYRALRADPGPAFAEVQLETFALNDATPATARINAALAEPFAGDPARSDWFECVSGALYGQGRDGDYGSVTRPVYITARWLAAETGTNGYCGGAHPWSDSWSLLFDRRTGAEVPIASWLNERGIERGAESWKIRPALRQIVLARWPAAEAECREVTQTADYWDAGVTRAGMRFTPSFPHALQACAQTVTVPWAALRPFLSAAGREGAASFSRGG